MRKNNKKGFTIVELVIVIAVIAILAAVLIPTFAGMVDKANKSADLQAATNALKSYVADNASEDEVVDLYIFVDNDTVYQVTAGKLAQELMDSAPEITTTTDGVKKAGDYIFKGTYEGCDVYAAE